MREMGFHSPAILPPHPPMTIKPEKISRMAMNPKKNCILLQEWVVGSLPLFAIIDPSFLRNHP
jgi:hypothetical protein